MVQMMREDIRKRQNSKWSLDRLAAQRLLYRQVKYMENWRLTFILLVAVLLLSGLSVGAGAFSQGATMAVVLLWFIDQAVLVPCVGRMKEEAAAVQEDFDCFVLDIPWPEHVGVARPTSDRVEELTRAAKKAGMVRNELADWYRPEDIPVEAVQARLHCQRVNCRWDSRLRGEWIWSVRFAVAVLAVLGVGVGAMLAVSLLEVVLGVAAGIRLLAWLLVEQRAHSLARKRMENLHGYLSRTEAESNRMTSCEVRLVQTTIFEHRRVCPTVPDWFYQFRRQAYEGMAGR